MSEQQDQTIEETDIVLYGVEAGVATITMNRPKYNNAQNGRMTYELDDAFKRAVADDEVKVIVLKGEGKHFSAGGDIKAMKDRTGAFAADGVAIRDGYRRNIHAFIHALN
ncbi:MAG: hypothetical protein EBY62_05550, partial [Cellvibrionales bacterium]|nr:hypothetical protein [Cellvibrionales bacterium]